MERNALWEPINQLDNDTKKLLSLVSGIEKLVLNLRPSFTVCSISGVSLISYLSVDCALSSMEYICSHRQRHNKNISSVHAT